MYESILKPKLNFEEIAHLVHYKAETAYLSGSQFDNLGHALSDLDVFVVTIDPALMQTEIINDFVEFGRVDIEFWPQSKLEEYTRRLEDFKKAGYEYDAQPRFSSEALSFLHRLCVGEAIFDAIKFENLKSKVDRKGISLDHCYTNLNLENSAKEDVLGMLDVKDYDSAALRSLKLLEHAVNAYVAAKGDTNPGAKWNYRKLRRLGLDEIYANLKRILNNESALSSEKLAVAALEFSKQLTNEAQYILEENK
jgi:hypothetical protein